MTTDRRIGIAVVLTAALTLIAVNRVSGRDLPGEATAAPLPPIPAVGSCLDLRGARPTPVPCSGPHTAEVSQSWRDGQVPTEISGRCAGVVDSGVTPSGEDGTHDWREPVVPTIPAQVTSGVPLGWRACVLVAAIQGDSTRLVSYRGSLTRSETEAESVIGSCFASDRPQGGRQQENPQIDCTRAHLAERLGEFFGDTTTAHPVSSCDEFARRQIGAAAFEGLDALHAVTGVDDSAGTLTVTVGQADEGTVMDSSTGAEIPMQTCSVVAPRPLVDTVLGIGNKPLPFG